MKNLTVLVLAAGEGKRLKPITTSKPLIPFAGQPLISMIVNNLKSLSFKRLVIVANPADKIKLQTLFPKALIAVQAQPTGMAAAVLAAKKDLKGPVVIVNGDDLIDPKIVTSFKSQLDKTPDQVVLTGITSNLTGAFFKFHSPANRLEIIEKPAVRPSQWFKIVLDYFPQIEDFEAKLESVKTKADDAYELALNQLTNLKLAKAQGKFYQIKYPWQILDLVAGLLPKLAKIHQSAKVMPGAHIINSYIGPRVIIGHNCLVRDSIIEAGSVVGYSTEIARSYIGPDSWFHSNYVGDSVIEGQVNLGSGARLANLRFDKKPIKPSNRLKFGAVLAKGVQLGINASIMPGVSVGQNSWVGSGMVLAKDLPPDSKALK